MQTSQQRILQQIEARVTARGLECAQSAAYANIGSINIFRPDATAAFAVITYDFQDQRYGLTLTVDKNKIASQPGRGDYFVFSSPYDQENSFWQALERHLPLAPAAAKPSKTTKARP